MALRNDNRSLKEYGWRPPNVHYSDKRGIVIYLSAILRDFTWVVGPLGE